MNKPVQPTAPAPKDPTPIDSSGFDRAPIEGPLSPEYIAQIEATCGKVPTSKGGTGPG